MCSYWRCCFAVAPFRCFFCGMSVEPPQEASCKPDARSRVGRAAAHGRPTSGEAFRPSPPGLAPGSEECWGSGHAPRPSVAGLDTRRPARVEKCLARAMLSDAMPGIVGLVDGGAPVDASLRLVRAMAARLRVHGGLRVEIDPAPTAPAVLGRVDLGILDPRPAPAVSAD